MWRKGACFRAMEEKVLRYLFMIICDDYSFHNLRTHAFDWCGFILHTIPYVQFWFVLR